MRNFPAFAFGLGCLVFAFFLGSSIGYIFGWGEQEWIKWALIALGIFSIWFSFKR